MRASTPESQDFDKGHQEATGQFGDRPHARVPCLDVHVCTSTGAPTCACVRIHRSNMHCISLCVGLVPDLGEYENRGAVLTDACLCSVYGDVQSAARGWVCPAAVNPMSHWLKPGQRLPNLISRYPWFANAMVMSVNLGSLALLAFQVIGVLSSRKGTVQFALEGGESMEAAGSSVREGGCVEGIFVGCQPYQILGCSCTHVSCL